jgi:hypothetical protein
VKKKDDKDRAKKQLKDDEDEQDGEGWTQVKGGSAVTAVSDPSCCALELFSFPCSSERMFSSKFVNWLTRILAGRHLGLLGGHFELSP